MRDRDWKGIAWITASVLVLAVGIIGIIVPVGGAPYCNGKPMSPGDTCVRVVTVGPGTGTKTTSTYDQMRGSNKTDGELLAFVGGVMLLASVSWARKRKRTGYLKRTRRRRPAQDRALKRRTARGLDKPTAVSPTSPQTSARAAGVPWMVIYACEGGREVPGVDRYATREAAAAASAKVKQVRVGADSLLVRGHSVMSDVTQDPAQQERKHAQSTDREPSHAYCPRCYRRFYPGDRTCECGYTIAEGWEELFVQRTGLSPAVRSEPATTPSS